MSERIVLGGLLLDNDKLYEVMPIINSDHFQHKDNKMIYKWMLERHAKQEPFDVISIGDAFGHQWIAFCGKFIARYLRHGNAPHHATIMRETYRRGILTEKLTSAVTELSNRGPCQDVINDISSFLSTLDVSGASQLRNIADSMEGFIDELGRRFASDGEFVGLTTGLKDLDNSIKGMQDGNLIIIAGRPAMGKSVLAQNIAQHNALSGKTVLFFSLEMTEEEIQQRLVSSVSGVDYGAIQSAECFNSDLMMPMIGEGIIKIKKGNFIIDDSSSLSIEELKTKAIAYDRKHDGVDLLVVDYLQLLTAEAENRFQVVSTISRELKALAKTLKCPVIALSQLSRSLESRSDRRPIMSDLRESGQLEQDADKIIFIYRDEVYNEQTRAKGLAEIMIGKARNCPKQNVVSFFDGAQQTFRDAPHTSYDIIDELKSSKGKPDGGGFNDFYKK